MGISSPANRLSVARATWRRRTLADTRVDELGLCRGQVASRGGLGGAERSRGCRRRRRLALGLPGAAGAAWRVAARRGARGVVLQSGPKPWGQRVGSGAWLQLARSGRVQCTHTRCSTQCRGMLQVAGEGGVYQIEVRSNGESSGHASLIKGASLQCNAKTHVKTDHADKVFDKMPRALRHFLEWPKSPDQCLCG